MSSNGIFATAFNCMDGRAVPAVLDWAVKELNVDYVDTISEPGMDAYLLTNDPQKRAWLKEKLAISVVKHGSRAVIVVGHDQCAGNPVTPEQHKKDIAQGVSVTRALLKEIDPELSVRVVGLWVFPPANGMKWSVEEVS